MHTSPIPHTHHPWLRRAVLLALLVIALSACKAAELTVTPEQDAGYPGLPETSGTAATEATPGPLEGLPETGANPTLLPSASAEAAPMDTPQSTQSGRQPQLPCTSPAQPIRSQTEGPYYKKGSPERTDLVEDGVHGKLLVLSGYVLTTDCQPVANAWLDFWQADANGTYDNQGYTLRGQQFTHADGYYELTTVVPGNYSGRTAHIHFKVRAPGGEVITSQLYFPEAARNQQDSLFDPSLIVFVTEESVERMLASFNIIVP